MIILLIVGSIKKTCYKMSYVSTYSEVKEEIVSVTLNLSHYATQKEFKNATNVNTSDFALKANVAEIKKKVHSIDVDKLDELQGKNYVEDSYLYFEDASKYLTTHKASDNTYVKAWQSKGRSNMKTTPPISLTHKFSPILFFSNTYEIVNFARGYLKTDTTICSKLNLPINIYFVIYLTDPPSTTISLANSLYGMMSYTKNGKTDSNEYTYSGYGVSFSSKKYTE